MSLNEIIKIVPDLLLLIIPGYVTLKIKEKYKLEKKIDNFDAVLHSILYSFIIGIVFSIIIWLCHDIFGILNTTSISDTIKQVSYLLLSVVFGFILVKLPKSKVGICIEKCFNKSLVPGANVWSKALDNPNGAWATVYLKNGLIYIGMLINYTSDPNDGVKEILLSNYRLSVRNESFSGNPNDFCCLITDNSSNNDAKVLLNSGDILSIEIQK